jgi:hypothetical protein
MALGQQFANTILGDDLKKGTVKHQKGVFTSERNYAIACRFYFHFQIRGLRYDRALGELNKEFWLSELRLAQLIMQEGKSLEALKAAQADTKILQKKFPHFSWAA